VEQLGEVGWNVDRVLGPGAVDMNVDRDVNCGCLCPDHRRINQLCALPLPSMIQNHAKVRAAVAIAFGFAFVSSAPFFFFEPGLGVAV